MNLPRPCISSARLRRILFPASIVAALLLCCFPSAHAQATFLGQASSANLGLSTPWRVAANSSGTVAIADTGNQRILRVPAGGGSPQTVSGGPGGYLRNIGIDDAGNIYAVTGSTLYKISPTGGTTTSDLGVGQALSDSCSMYTCYGTVQPFSIAIDHSGNIFVAYGQPLYEVIEVPAGGGSPFVVNTYPFILSTPTGLATDNSGNLYIGDSYNDRIVIVPPTGNAYGVAPPGLNLKGNLVPNTYGLIYGGGVNSLGVDSQGNIYAGCTNYNGGGNFLARISPDGQSYISLPIGNGGVAGIGVDANDNLYFSNNNSQLITYSTRYAAFGNVNVGTASSAINLSFLLGSGTTVSNVNLYSLGLDQQAVSSPTGEFQSTAPVSCTGTPAICSVSVTFTPQVPGPRSGAAVAYNVVNNTPSLLTPIPLIGTGLGPNTVFDSAASTYTPLQVSTSTVGLVGQSVQDGAGNTYAALPAVNKVVAVSASGTISTVFTSANYPLTNPQGVAIDGLGNLFIADTGNNRILKIPFETETELATAYANQTVPTVLSLPGVTLNSPTQLTTDNFGNLYIANSGNGEVDELTPSGRAIKLASGFQNIYGIALDGSGNLYIGDGTSIYQLAPGATSTTRLSASSQLAAPGGIAADAGGTVYVADFYKGILELHPDGTVTALGTLYAPESVSLTAAGSVLVSVPSTPAGLTGTNLLEFQRATPPSLTFATTLVNTTSSDSPQSVTVSNAGNQALSFTQLFPPTDFPEATGVSNTCTSASVLSAGLSCSIPLTFHPTRAATLQEDVLLSTKNAAGTAVSKPILLTGTGTAGGQAQTIAGYAGGTNCTRTPTYTYTSVAILCYGSSSSGLPVTFHIVSGPGNFAGASTVTLPSGAAATSLFVTGAGTVVIQATQPGNATYAPATPVTSSVTINPATITATVTQATQVYGSSLPTFTYTLHTLVNSTDQLSLKLASGVSATSPVGSYQVTYALSGASAASYTLSADTTQLSVTAAPLTGTVITATKLYGDPLPTFSPSFTGLVNNDVISATYQTSATAASPVGSYAVTPTFSGAALSNYTLTTTSGTLIIGKRILLVQVNPLSLHYGSTPGGFTETITGFVNNDTASVVTGTPQYTTSASSTSPPGNYEVDAVSGILSATNYGFSYIPGTLTITGPYPYIWVLNSDSTLAKLAPTGSLVSSFGSSATASTQGGVAFDASGNIWSVTSGTNALSMLTAPGSAPAIITGGGINKPAAIAIDGAGLIWIANSGGNSVSVYSPTGYFLTGTQGYTLPSTASPSAIAIDSSGAVWIANPGNNTISQIIGAATPVATPLSTQVTNGTLATKP